jgi:hypothetical protein
MGRFGLRASCVWVAFSTPLPAAIAEPIATMGDVGAAIFSCWSAPEGTDKSAVTLRFSFKRDGSLIGPPKPTAVDIEGDAELRRRFIEAAVDAVERCTPVSLAPALAQGIGGRVFTMRFSSPDYAPSRQVAAPQ